MRPKTIKNTLLFIIIAQIGVFGVNLILIIRTANFLQPIEAFLDELLRHSGIIVLGGYSLYFVAFLLLIHVHKASLNLKHMLRIVFASSLGVIIIWVYFVFLESAHYSNYVFSTYSVYLPSLKTFATFHIVLLVGGYFFTSVSQKWQVKFLYDYVLPMFIVVLFALTFLGDISKIARIFLNERKFVSLFVSSGGKVEDVPDFVRLKKWSRFISFYTEDNSTLIHPKQSVPYPVIGNQPLARYFLYPRTLVSTTFMDTYLKTEKADNTYYLLKKAQDNPDEFFPGEQLIKELDIDTAYVLLTDGEVNKYGPKELLGSLDEIYDEIDIGIIKIR